MVGRVTVSLGRTFHEIIVAIVLVNIREPPVLGIVCASGISFVLNEAILGLEWAGVNLILVVIPGVVALSGLSSAWIRGRLT